MSLGILGGPSAIGALTPDLVPLPMPTTDWFTSAWQQVEEYTGQPGAMTTTTPSATPAMQKGLVPGATPSTGQYPWKAYSAATLALQKQLNVLLRTKGLCAMGEDGKLGAGTCGAAQMFGMAPGTCQAFTTPKPCPGGAIAPASPATLPAATAAPKSSRALLYIAGAVAIGAIALVLTRKKGARE